MPLCASIWPILPKSVVYPPYTLWYTRHTPCGILASLRTPCGILASLRTPCGIPGLTTPCGIPGLTTPVRYTRLDHTGEVYPAMYTLWYTPGYVPPYTPGYTTILPPTMLMDAATTEPA